MATIQIIKQRFFIDILLFNLSIWSFCIPVNEGEWNNYGHGWYFYELAFPLVDIGKECPYTDFERKEVCMNQKGRRFLYNDNTVGYVFAMPFIVGFLCFTIIPMGVSLYFSFTKYNMLSHPVFVGVRNYIRIFTDDARFPKSIRVTFFYVVVSVILKLSFALLVAVLLTRKAKFLGFYRSIYYLPSLVGGSVSVALVWKQLFATKGLFNNLRVAMGLSRLSWFGDPKLAIWPLILMSVWQFGSSMIIFAAGLKQIPTTYYEAATIDGAGAVRRFFSITLPCLSPVILFNLIMQMITGFMSFTQVYIISNGTGDPNDATNFIALYTYNQAFKYNDMGYASAIAWVLLVIISIVTYVLFRTSHHWVFYGNE
jgi:multiple sugar transport system permease protein